MTDLFTNHTVSERIDEMIDLIAEGYHYEDAADAVGLVVGDPSDCDTDVSPIEVVDRITDWLNDNADILEESLYCDAEDKLNYLHQAKAALKADQWLVDEYSTSLYDEANELHDLPF
jgi:hypothetical protein